MAVVNASVQSKSQFSEEVIAYNCFVGPIEASVCVAIMCLLKDLLFENLWQAQAEHSDEIGIIDQAIAEMELNPQQVGIALQ